jgi:glucitol/sorbitol PTS system EIIA component
MTASDSVVYESAVTQVGSQVPAFLEHGILIFFGTNAPEELHDMSVLHDVVTADDGPRPGDTMILGDTRLEILAVGSVVRDNLLNLGHLDLKADGLSEAKLPGDVCVRTGDLPLLTAGDGFTITRPPHQERELP